MRGSAHGPDGPPRRDRRNLAGRLRLHRRAQRLPSRERRLPHLRREAHHDGGLQDRRRQESLDGQPYLHLGRAGADVPDPEGDVPLLIDRDEVTNGGYDFCVRAGACEPRNLAHCETLGLADGVREGSPLRAAAHPAVCVTPPQAEAHCRWRGGRLPTEAEWEKAARGEKVRLFPWGETWDDRATNWGDEKDGKYGTLDGWPLTAPVGSFPGDASPYGARDMGGNVWEWTGDWYAPDAYAKGVPASGDRRVTRGG